MFQWTVCPEGYKLQPGDLPGTGDAGKPSKQKKISGCSRKCNDEEKCCSFEHSPSIWGCHLNKDCSPTEPIYRDWNFCTKGNIAHKDQTH